MNERIKELMIEAGSTGTYQVWFTQNEVHKLTELIIQDCVTEVALMGVTNHENEDISWACRVIIDGIKSKFGV